MSAAAVRLAGPDDAGALAAVYRPYVVDSVVSFEEQPPDAAARRCTRWTPTSVPRADQRPRS